MQAPPDLRFKFKYVGENHRIKGLSAQKGAASQTGLVLGEETLSFDQIVETTVRDKRLAIVIAQPSALGQKLAKQVLKGPILVLEIYKVKALALKRHIDRAYSTARALRHKQQLVQAEKGDLFRATRCPECEAAIDLSELTPSPYVYCRYCDTVFNPKKEIVTKGTVYHLCDECSLFGRVQDYTEFYFYFFLVVYGFSYKKRYLCDHCAHRMFLRTLAANFIFILGVPVSLYQKLKSMIGRDRVLGKLAQANALALDGHYQKAAPIYRKILEKYPEHPGLLMNEGVGRLRGKDVQGAMSCFECALKACSNYLPVIRMVRQLQNSATRPVGQTIGRN